MKLKSGEEITIKEFFKRWKIGIENLTPLQKMTNEARGTFVTLLGFVVSFFAVIWFREKIGILAYGLILIFLGSIWTTALKYIGLRQQVKLFKNLEKEFNSQESSNGEKLDEMPDYETPNEVELKPVHGNTLTNDFNREIHPDTIKEELKGGEDNGN